MRSNGPTQHRRWSLAAALLIGAALLLLPQQTQGQSNSNPTIDKTGLPHTTSVAENTPITAATKTYRSPPLTLTDSRLRHPGVDSNWE